MGILADCCAYYGVDWRNKAYRWNWPEKGLSRQTEADWSGIKQKFLCCALVVHNKLFSGHGTRSYNLFANALHVIFPEVLYLSPSFLCIHRAYTALWGNCLRLDFSMLTHIRETLLLRTVELLHILILEWRGIFLATTK